MRSPPGAEDDDGRPRPGPATTDKSATTTDAGHSIGSRQVSWWSFHEYAERLLTEAGSWPMVGTPAWCDLPDDDPRKRAAIFDAAQHWALRIETSQAAMAEASHDISAAADWPAIADHIKTRREFYAEHPWLRREASL